MPVSGSAQAASQSDAQMKKNIVIVGGSYAAVAACFRARSILPSTHRIIIIEKHSHLHFMFAFPRAIVLDGFEHELFVPYTKMFSSPDQGVVYQAAATAITATHVLLDRAVADPDDDTTKTDRVAYDYLIYAAGASHPEPTSLSEMDEKKEAIAKLKEYQRRIASATKVLVCGGGAAGIEVACEVKEHYPEKDVVLVHSRERYMMPYREALHQRVFQTLEKYGVRQILGERVVVPDGGFPNEGKMTIVRTKSGIEIECDLQIMCTGLIPNSAVLKSLSPASIDPAGYVRVYPNMQIQDPSYPRIFAAGDVTATDDVKTAHSAWHHGWTCIENIVTKIKTPNAALQPRPKSVPQIILYLGMHQGAAQM
ncbi:hypothetical protein HDU96_010284, partial [Phlyctochytrium bullatum]